MWHKCFWVGQSAHLPWLNSPLGKVHKEGLELLRLHGWFQVGPDTELLPVFALTTRRGANFPASGPGLPKIRQLPQQCSAVLDDKRAMFECVAKLGISPQTWVDVDVFLREFQQSGSAASAAPAPTEPLQRSSQGGADASPQPTAPQAACSSSWGRAPAEVGTVPHDDPGSQPAVPSTAAGRPGAADGDPDSRAAVPSTAAGPEVKVSPSQPHGCSGWEAPPLYGPGQPHPPWFLKHRRGVKGQAVYCFCSLAELLGRLSTLSMRSRRDFVIQRGVPPLLLRGRKFVLRAHVVLLLSPAGAPPQAFLHRDVIVLEHAKQYSPASSDRAVHISSCGKAHPKPYLLGELLSEPQEEGSQLSLGAAADSPASMAGAAAAAGMPAGAGEQQPRQRKGQEGRNREEDQVASPGGDSGLLHGPPARVQLRTPLQHSLWAQICWAAAASLRAGAAAGLLPQDYDPEATLYHLFGYDFLVDCGGKAWLLEVNAYPAIASGTMAGVDRQVFTDLVLDLLTLVVLPVTDGAAPEPGGFVQLEV